MQDATHNQKPTNDAVSKVIEAFSKAPVFNPNGNNGITLHVDLSHAVPYEDKTSFIDLSFGLIKTDFDRIKENNFTSNRKKIFRYALFAHNISVLGFRRDNSGIAELPGNDLMVTLGSFTGGTGTTNDQAGTLMHEIGHTLGLHHGGSDDVNYKPNYISVMNYSFQFIGIPHYDSVTRELISSNLDYSNSSLSDVNENNIDESIGIIGDNVYTYHYCGGVRMRDLVNKSIDWNCNGSIENKSLSVSVNDDSVKEILHSHDDWSNIIYRFQDLGNYSDGVRSEQDVVDVNEEITPEIVIRLGLDLIPDTVEIDVKPGSDTNPTNLKTKGAVPIVVFGSKTVNVNTINIESINISGASVKQFNKEDANKDGLDDLSLKVNTEDLVLLDNTSKSISLVAKTYDGRMLYGTDTIKIVP